MKKNISEYLHVDAKDDASPFMCQFDKEIDLESLKPHWHEHLEIRYITSGEMEFVCDSNAYRAKTGDVVIINPCERHMNRISNISNTRYHSLIVDISEKYTGFLFRKYFAPIIYRSYKFPNVISDSHLEKMILGLFEDLKQPNELNVMKIYSNFLQTVFYLRDENMQFKSATKMSNSQKRHKEIVDVALEYIFDHYTEQINLIDIAESCFISEAHLCRIFKRETGKSPINFIIDYRINKAIIFLTNSDLNIALVAEKCGFTDGAYFSRCFKKRMGMSPSEYVSRELSSGNQQENKESQNISAKEKYLDIMEKALNCYTAEKIESYYEEVKQSGLREHGFPRLTANMGVLIAYGRCLKYKTLFCKMMSLCCKLIPVSPEAANDFSVREICLCIQLLKDKKNVVDNDLIRKWLEQMRGIDPRKTYTAVASSADDELNNWAIFAGVSEYFRNRVCGVDTGDFIDMQFASQIKYFDANGMYNDPGSPMVYDCISRLLFDFALHFGYNGKYADILKKYTNRAAEKSLLFQSVTGEMPYGGRSMQCLHNEMWLAADYEYHAARLKDTNPALAGKFKMAAEMACQNLLWSIDLYQSHVKNCFPYDKKIGCENYAYFEKYMITAASAAYLAFLLADDEVAGKPLKDKYIISLGKSFHKLFLKGFDWFVEIDTNADFHYDANGIGRIQKKGCPPTIALSVPFPGKDALYLTEKPNTMPMSLCSFVEKSGTVLYGSVEECNRITTMETEESLSVSVNRRMDGASFDETYTISKDNIVLSQNMGENAGFMLPVISFDGKNFSEISDLDGEITVRYLNHICTYSFDGKIAGCNMFYNRNGEYKVFKVFANSVTITMK